MSGQLDPYLLQALQPTRQDAPLATHTAHAPVLTPTALTIGTRSPARQVCWDQLGVHLRTRACEKAGSIDEWWLHQDSAGTGGYLIGDALVAIEPTVNTRGRPAHLLRRWPLDLTSRRVVDITDTIPVTHAPSTAPATRPPTGPLPAGLTIDGFLGNLPPRAQQLMLAPFLRADEKIFISDDYYEGAHGADGMLTVCAVLASRHTMTYLSGVRSALHPGRAVTWKLRCRRVEISRPAPSDGVMVGPVRT